MSTPFDEPAGRPAVEPRRHLTEHERARRAVALGAVLGGLLRLTARERRRGQSRK